MLEATSKTKNLGKDRLKLTLQEIKRTVYKGLLPPRKSIMNINLSS